MGLMTAAALMPAKPVPSPAPVPAKKQMITVNIGGMTSLFFKLPDIPGDLLDGLFHKGQLLRGDALGQCVHKAALGGGPLADDPTGGGQGVEPQDFPVPRRMAGGQQALPLQPMDRRRHVGLGPAAQAHRIRGGIVLRIVVEEQQQVKLHPGQSGIQGHRVQGFVVELFEQQYVLPKRLAQGGGLLSFYFELTRIIDPAPPVCQGPVRPGTLAIEPGFAGGNGFQDEGEKQRIVKDFFLPNGRGCAKILGNA